MYFNILTKLAYKKISAYGIVCVACKFQGINLSGYGCDIHVYVQLAHLLGYAFLG